MKWHWHYSWSCKVWVRVLDVPVATTNAAGTLQIRVLYVTTGAEVAHG